MIFFVFALTIAGAQLRDVDGDVQQQRDALKNKDLRCALPRHNCHSAYSYDPVNAEEMAVWKAHQIAVKPLSIRASLLATLT